jgi:hypothetical protein
MLIVSDSSTALTLITKSLSILWVPSLAVTVTTVPSFFNSTDFEAREDHTYSVEVTARRTDADGTTTKTTTKTITVTVTDIVDDEAPTNIQITSVNLTAGHPTIAPIGILSAEDKDTKASKLVFTTDSIGFIIVKGKNGYELMTTGRKTITDGTVVTVTVSDGTHSTDKDFVMIFSTVFLLSPSPLVAPILTL